MKHLEAGSCKPRTVLDVGCNIGYFSLSFVERGAVSYGVEMESLALRTATIASRRIARERGCFVPVRLKCTPESVALLPDGDVTICLSIWHHWVRYMGLEAGTAILRSLWERTNHTLFFDTGENEMPGEYNLPFRHENATTWLAQYLADNLSGGVITDLGRFKAFSPGGHEATAHVSRTLFAVTRKVS